MKQILVILALGSLLSTAPAFLITSFTAYAVYQNNMVFRADIGYRIREPSTPRATALGFCNGYLPQCQSAGSPYPFSATTFTAFPGCGAAPDGFHWDLRVDAFNTVTNKRGFNLVVEYDHDPNHGKVYGCRFFAYDQLSCGKSGGNGSPDETGNWLVAPPAFSITAQTASACLYDSTSTSLSARAAATPESIGSYNGWL